MGFGSRKSRVGLALVGIWSALTVGLLSGCASGGYKMTRTYAGFVNKQNIIIRIILYILTGVVFAVTMLLDVVIFNTMDFWEGRVSQGTYHFNGEEKTYVVEHRQSEDGLRQSTIVVSDAKSKARLQELVLKETKDQMIEVYVDGKLHTQVTDISLAPKFTSFNQHGQPAKSDIYAAL